MRAVIFTLEQSSFLLLLSLSCRKILFATPSWIADLLLFQGRMDKDHVPLKMTAHSTVWGILVVTFSSLGVFFSLLVIIFFLFKFQHPVVIGQCSYLLRIIVRSHLHYKVFSTYRLT